MKDRVIGDCHARWIRAFCYVLATGLACGTWIWIRSWPDGTGDRGGASGSKRTIRTVVEVRDGAGEKSDRTRPGERPVDVDREIAGLAERLQATVRFVALSEAHGDLTPEAIELLDLSPEERWRIQDSIDAAIGRLKDLERANARLEMDPGGGVVIVIAAFPSEGGEVRSELVRGMEGIVGRDRSAMLERAIEGSTTVFGGFGRIERTISFEEEFDPVLQELGSTDRIRISEGEGGSRFSLSVHQGSPIYERFEHVIVGLLEEARDRRPR